MHSDAPSETDITAAAGDRPEIALQPGIVFGARYALEERIASGGMGELFRAFDLRLQRRVALKVLRKDEQESADAPSARILHEARAAAALNHPHVVAIHDVGVREGIPFIAMEYVEGRPLREFIGAALPFPTKLRWMTEVAEALAAAHAKGLVHRDVKPDNVMIRDDTGSAKVLDFGIARSTHASWSEGGGVGTSGSTVVGTPGYMAPEQIRGESFDGRADQFAWGVVAYELFSGQMPWPESRGTTALATAVLRVVAKPLSNVPFELAQVIDRALAKRAEDRYPSMGDIAAALNQAAGAAEPLQTATADAQLVDPRLLGVRPPETTAKPKWRRPRLRSPRTWVVALAVVGAAGGALSLRSPHEAPPPPVLGPPPKTPASDMPVTALPLSPSCNKTAEIRYREGLAAQREATWELARPAFEQAAAADPMCPEVQLQLLVTAYFRYTVTKEREQFRRVMSMRDSLSERDRVLLDAWAPLVGQEPANREEAARRFDAAVDRYPRDAQMLTLAAMAHTFLALDALALERTIDFARRAIAVDPKYGEAWQQEAGALLRLGRADEAMNALDQCMRVAPGSGECLLDRIRILSARGQCGEAVTSARQWITNVPRSSGAYRHLANALASEGAPAETVETALQHWRNNTHEESRDALYVFHRASLAALRGDFLNLEKLVAEFVARIEDSATLFDHARAAAMQVELYTETGRPAQAAEAAEQFLRRKDAWTEGFWSAMPYDPMMYGTLLRQGRMPRERWRTLTDAWEKGALSTLDKRQAWALRWGEATETREMAAEAWSLRPPPVPLAGSLEQPATLTLLTDTLQGHVGQLVGEHAEAVPLFEPMTRSCHVLEQPFMNTRAHLWLGDAKEHTGDKDGACKAYGVVVQRWGEAKPRSSSAHTAKERRQALGCKGL
ncbi:protein kinase [Pendulispora rubella]|uniref:Protein kinase n=1 Tax=Pendulispora rubella TaxID=2741070 RepID=A0ABZ2L429_9BACT